MKDTKPIVTPELARARSLIAQGENLLILGPGGTGKSDFLERLRDSSNKSLMVVAFMGCAALNVGGQTIHSAFRLGIDCLDPEKCRHYYRPPPHLAALEPSSTRSAW
jgi:hypothetical protein